MKKKEIVEKTPKVVKEKKPKVENKASKPKDIHICTGCLEETDPTELYLVALIDKLELSFQTPFCQKCIKEKNYFENYISYEVLGTLHKKRVYKKKITSN